MNEERRKYQLLENEYGDYSSGRLMKLMSAFFAVGFGVYGMFLITSAPENSVLADYCLKQTALFLGVATGSELVQKLTGK